jgi:molybdopterin synthase catalytic subunit
MIEIVREPIDLARLRRELLRASDGACVVFEGVVRDHASGRRVIRLEYEAYEEMAASKLEEIRRGILDRHEVRDVAIAHRIGPLEIGETAVAVVVAAAHRGPAFDACRLAMDAIKAEVPIFKHEFYEDGDRWIEGAG